MITLVHWIAIYLMHSVIHPLNNIVCVRGSWILGMLQTELLMYEIQHSVIVCSFGVIMMHERNS